MKFSADSKFWQICVRLLELTKINLLWLLCCLPIFTAGASTCAMLTCLYARQEGEPCGSGPFFRAFRRFFRKSTALWLGILFFGAMLAVDYTIVAYLEFPGRMAVIVLIFFVFFLLLLFAGLVFPLLCQFPDTLKNLVINTVLLCLAHLPKVLLVAAVNLLPIALLILLPQVFILTGFLWLLGGFAWIALYDIRVLERIFAPFRNPEK